MGIFSAPKAPKAPKPTPPAPRISDSELLAKAEADKLRKRRGVEDQILSLGRVAPQGVGDRPGRTVSLLGQTGV